MDNTIRGRHRFTYVHIHIHTGHRCTGPANSSPLYEYTPKLKELDGHRPELPETNPLLKAAHHSPLAVAAWAAALRSHPDTEFVGYILEGIQNGFRIGFNYKNNRTRSTLNNLISTKDHPDIVKKYLTTECTKGRMLGPFPTSSIPDIQINRIGVIPKKSTPNKWRLITDLSFPPGNSVNEGISPELTSLSYMKVDQIAQKIIQLGRGAQLSKMDIEEAYRMVPIHPDDRHLLGCQSDNQVYIDLSLPFGLRSAPIIFTAVADGLQWIIEQRGASHIAHYLDDFITVGAPNTDQCYVNQQIIFETCRELGIPLAPHKTVGPTTCLIFLGIEIDTIALELRLPQETLRKLQELLQEWQFKRICTRHSLESLLGYLNHACKAVRPGRSFIGRLIAMLTQAKRTHRTTIRINNEARSDIRWWHLFVSSWNGVSMLREHHQRHPDYEFWSDASGSWGVEALWHNHWFQIKWPPSLQPTQIAIKELIPITLACAIWGNHWKKSTIRANCDNEAVVAIINSGYSREPFLMHLLRCIFFLSAKYEFSLVATHVPGQQNELADAISRDNAALFLSLSPQADHRPTEIPQDWINKLLIEKPDWTSNSWILWFHTTFNVP